MNKQRLYYYAYDDGSDFVNGQHYVTGTFSEAVAKRKVINNRIREQLGKKKYKLDNGYIKIKLIENVTEFAKKQKLFGIDSAPFDKWVMDNVYDNSERFRNKTGQYSECINIDPEQGVKKLKAFFKKGPTPPGPVNEPVLITPRDTNHESDIAKVKKKWTQTHDKILKEKNSIVITQEAACGSFKSTTWRLVYDELVCPELKKAGSQIINLVGAPDKGIVRDLALKNAGHDIKLGQNSLHIVYTDIAGKDNENVTNLIEDRGVILVKPQTIKRDGKGKVIQQAKTKSEVLKDIITSNPDKAIWIYTTFSSYYRKRVNGTLSKHSLVCVMQDLEMSWSFKFVDEVHMTFQPDFSSWMKVHDRTIVDCRYTFLATATWPKFRNNKKKNTKIKNVDKRFRIGKYADFKFPSINNINANKRGYIRKYKVRDYSFSLEHAKDIKDLVFDGKEPYFEVNGTDIVVPYTYYTNLTANFQSRLELGDKVAYTHVTVNSLANGRLLRDFINSAKSNLAEYLTGSKNNLGYEALANIHVELMDTNDDESIKLRELADSIPEQYDNAIIIHCKLNEHGWNPGETSVHKGFINAIQFFDPTFSTKRITQNSGRAARNPSLQDECYLIQSHTYDPTDECHLNERWENVARTCTALEIGKEQFGDTVTLLDYQPKKRKGRKDRTTGRTLYESDFLINGDFFVDNLKAWIDAGGLEHSIHQYHYVVYTPGSDLLKDYDDYYKDKKMPKIKPSDVYHVRYNIGWHPQLIIDYIEQKGYDTTTIRRQMEISDTYIFNLFCSHKWLTEQKSKYIIVPYTYMINDLLGLPGDWCGPGFYTGRKTPFFVKKIQAKDLGQYNKPIAQIDFLQEMQTYKTLTKRDFNYMRDLGNYKTWAKDKKVSKFYEKKYEVTKPDGEKIFFDRKQDIKKLIEPVLKKLNLVAKADRYTQIFKDGKIMITAPHKRIKQVKGSTKATGKGRGVRKWINGAPGWGFKEKFQFKKYLLINTATNKISPSKNNSGSLFIRFGLKHNLLKLAPNRYSQR